MTTLVGMDTEVVTDLAHGLLADADRMDDVAAACAAWSATCPPARGPVAAAPSVYAAADDETVRQHDRDLLALATGACPGGNVTEACGR